MPRIQPDEWRPRGVDSLEPVAELVVRSEINSLVIAGPGAGKTELLAQRACYLLETGKCRYPRRILAISFKRDAAKNLEIRVRKRCGELSRRFDSFTLDGFGKSLVDRFRNSIPEEWRPQENYDVLLSAPTIKAMRHWLDAVSIPASLPQLQTALMKDEAVRTMFEFSAFGVALPYDQHDLHGLFRFIGLKWWQQHLLRPEGGSELMFPMLNRLAAYLLRLNPMLMAAARGTYSHVFMDEYQDTTPSQYDLVRTMFLGSSAVVTAVGDSKQRIMLWAGAMKDAFSQFSNDFTAEQHRLIRNYRSAPELVRIQDVIAKSIEADSPTVVPSQRNVTQGVCYVAEFQTPEQEAAYLTDMIAGDIESGLLAPRDVCVLARQKAGEMVEILRTALRARGVRLRDESELQDLLAEPVSQLAISVLRLAARERDPEAWDCLNWDLAHLSGKDIFGDEESIEHESADLVRFARALIKQRKRCEELPAAIIERIGAARVRAAHRQYANPAFLQDRLTRLGNSLAATGATELRSAVDDLIGEEIIPAMTVHKSKGLEFHTVIFLGLEDAQLWNFAKQTDEEVRGFFVAFSRATTRVVFTFSDRRDGKFGRQTQAKTTIKDLYSLLRAANVETHDFRSYRSAPGV